MPGPFKIASCMLECVESRKASREMFWEKSGLCWFMPEFKLLVQFVAVDLCFFSDPLVFPVPLIAFAEVLLGLTSLIAVLLLVFAPDPSSELVEPWHTLMSMIYQYVSKERI